MSEPSTTTIDVTPEESSAQAARKGRKPPSEWKKTTRMKAVKTMDPDFIGKFELAKHLCCHIQSINEWIFKGSIPPPHSRPGMNHPIWLRKHYEVFVKTGKWPAEAWKSRKDGEE